MQTNIFRALQDLLPQPQLTIAAIQSINPDGSCTVLYPGGNIQKVLGSSPDFSPGQNVFIRNARIEGPAPTLPSVTIDV
jgi:hypothetical protein